MFNADANGCSFSFVLNKGGVLYYIFYIFFSPMSVTFWRSLYVGESVSTTCGAILCLSSAPSAKLKAFCVVSELAVHGGVSVNPRGRVAFRAPVSLRDPSLEADVGLLWGSRGFQGGLGLVRAVTPRVFSGRFSYCFCAFLKSSQGFSAKVVGTLPSLCPPQLPFRRALGRALLPDSHIVFSV